MNATETLSAEVIRKLAVITRQAERIQPRSARESQIMLVAPH